MQRKTALDQRSKLIVAVPLKMHFLPWNIQGKFCKWKPSDCFTFFRMILSAYLSATRYVRSQGSNLKMFFSKFITFPLFRDCSTKMNFWAMPRILLQVCRVFKFSYVQLSLEELLQRCKNISSLKLYVGSCYFRYEAPLLPISIHLSLFFKHFTHPQVL